MIDRLVGILLGTAVGDALGMPAEGLSPRRRRRLTGQSGDSEEHFHYTLAAKAGNNPLDASMDCLAPPRPSRIEPMALDCGGPGR